MLAGMEPVRKAWNPGGAFSLWEVRTSRHWGVRVTQWLVEGGDPQENVPLGSGFQSRVSPWRFMILCKLE